MSKGFNLLRVEYIFTVIVPCLICIYINEYNAFEYIWILAGFAFYAMAGNTLNDFFDIKNPKDKETKDRVQDYSRREIFALFLCNFILGSTCFMTPIIKHPILAVYLALTVILVVLYCLFKNLVFVNHIMLGVSHMLLPWAMIKIAAGDTLLNFLPALSLNEIMVLLCASALAFTGEMLHEQIDGDSITRFSLKTIQKIVWVAAIISLVIGVISLIITRYFIFLPFVFFPFGIMFIYRKPQNLRGKTTLKDTGIIMGNLFFIFVIILLISQQIN